MTDQLTQAGPSPLQRLQHPLLEERQVAVWVKRDDLLRVDDRPESHAFCGNKWRKLKYNLLAAQEGGYRCLATFGGAYSNHIAATAAAARLFGFTSVGIIRGEAVYPLNATLSQARALGMTLEFLDRAAYRHKEQPEVAGRLREKWPDAYWIPEGGTNTLALRGAGELIAELKAQLPEDPDFLATSCGTGGTMAGMVQATESGEITFLGFPALKGDFLGKVVAQLTGVAEGRRFRMINDYHFGGYARYDQRLLDFIRFFHTQFGILLDPVYTGKTAFGLWEKIKEDYFLPGSKIVLLHTGGLQGWKGFSERRQIAPPGIG